MAKLGAKSGYRVTAEANSPKRVNVLYIEGDALMIKGQNKNNMELHRFQVAEGVVQIGRRRIIEGVHYVAEFYYDDAKEEISNYIANHYDLNNTVVITNSDGGLGYGKNVFDEIIGMAKRHEHFRDRYHVIVRTKSVLDGLVSDLSVNKKSH